MPTTSPAHSIHITLYLRSLPSTTNTSQFSPDPSIHPQTTYKLKISHPIIPSPPPQTTDYTPPTASPTHKSSPPPDLSPTSHPHPTPYSSYTIHYDANPSRVHVPQYPFRNHSAAALQGEVLLIPTFLATHPFRLLCR